MNDYRNSFAAKSHIELQTVAPFRPRHKRSQAVFAMRCIVITAVR